MSDWVGLAFFVSLAIAAVAGLRFISRPQTRTEAEFERNAAEGTTMMGAGMNALQELLNPEAAKAKEVQMQMKDGRYQRKRREGKAGGSDKVGRETSEEQV